MLRMFVVQVEVLKQRVVFLLGAEICLAYVLEKRQGQLKAAHCWMKKNIEY